METHKDLRVWQQSMEMVTSIYLMTKTFPKEELFGLVAQMHRAAVSVPSNIAEGNGRIALKEQIHFLEIAFGSVMEVYCQLQIAQDLNYITEEEFNQIKPVIYNTSKLISGLRSSKVALLPH